MVQAIIFDFNRTLFNPETNKFSHNVGKILTKLSKGFSLGLISSREKGREDLIKTWKTAKLFRCTKIVKIKTESEFIKMSNLLNANPKYIVVVGDRIKDEILIGNRLGMVTVWLKKGKFSSEIPQKISEEPDFIINNLSQLTKLLDKINIVNLP
ncbi:hypothetical protein A2863_01570 [Candidatus Woesebacteria bacterium RIFCSPHIGHO2_01_FULL_38_9b]|uniref:HAD family hydrolase n=1 Tax=Candidatus Woesebacteria bacterium RIFCSPHIGHO2_01_FULL_38_9b TaxID=1802493 RepID=A0A1F7Y0I8_9BACT|nr:MAG: hypothetical protein A2863_01570 [Candidatus Woesebacteria bacterium RIFCSPHIGHO2_01_FULL_38_9b]